jgi:hypothetical protein
MQRQSLSPSSEWRPVGDVLRRVLAEIEQRPRLPMASEAQVSRSAVSTPTLTARHRG